MIRLAPVIKELLTPDQFRKLPSLIASYLDTRYLAMVRAGTQGAGSPFGMQGMDMMGPAMVGGGGGATVIIR
jgi:hypothetical protein